MAGKLKISLQYDYHHDLNIEIAVEPDVVEVIVADILDNLHEAMERQYNPKPQRKSK